MSFGSLSAAAVEAMNRGAALAGALQNTGEGGISDHHRKGGELIWQIGTGYFGCRDDHGRFSMDRLLETVASAKVRAIEIKLSPGREARPRRRAARREDHAGDRARSAASRWARTASARRTTPRSRDVSSMLDFIERIADATGLPGRDQVRGRRPGVLARARRADRRAPPRARLHHDRRRRGRHRRRAAGVHRSRRPAVQARVHPGLSRVRRGRRAPLGRVHRLGQARVPRDRRCSRSRSAAT